MVLRKSFYIHRSAGRSPRFMRLIRVGILHVMLCALDMSVHSTHIVYDVECPCRGLHTLVMGLSAVAQIALHWCVVTPHYMGVCTWY